MRCRLDLEPPPACETMAPPQEANVDGRQRRDRWSSMPEHVAGSRSSREGLAGADVIVLGVHDGHNASAALLKDGELVAAAQEERFTRVKNQGGMPSLAIQDVLERAGASKDDVDVFAFPDRYHYNQQWDRASVLRLFATSGQSPMRVWAGHLPPVRAFRAKQLLTRRRRQLAQGGFPPKRTDVVEHHTCHAAAAYYGQGTYDRPVLVLTADGVGDFLCASVSVGEHGRLTRMAAVADLHSLGLLYAKITFLMGMVPLEHEHKIMGLAPYGAKSPDQVEEIKKRFLRLFQFSPDGMTWTMPERSRTMAGPLDFLREIMDCQRFDHLAAGLQLFLEEMLVTWVENCVRRTGVRDVALGGGVFMNVKANKRILESPEVNSVFVMPSCGDETNSMGAAYAASSSKSTERHEPVSIRPLGHLYLGETITDEQARRALDAGAAGGGDLSWQQFTDAEKEVARLLASGNVVARAVGPMEFGARALGNRSILADPSDPEVAAIINDMIKDRDFWMPFAPSILAERSDAYVSKPKPVAAPYMTLTFDAQPEKRRALRAACHPSDHTLRPQEVYESWNPAYHRLLRHVADLTGEAVVLNTSFNLHGFPIVRTADDALEVFRRSGLKYMQLASFIVEKEETPGVSSPRDDRVATASSGGHIPSKGSRA